MRKTKGTKKLTVSALAVGVSLWIGMVSEAGCGSMCGPKKGHDHDSSSGDHSGSKTYGDHKHTSGKAEASPEAGKPPVKPYPLDYCLVSKEKLGEMGDPFVMVHEGQEIKFCCKGCVKKFNADPAKYLEILKKSKTPPKDKKPEGHDHSGHNH
jgi:hypothetical protein